VSDPDSTVTKREYAENGIINTVKLKNIIISSSQQPADYIMGRVVMRRVENQCFFFKFIKIVFCFFCGFYGILWFYGIQVFI